MKDTTNFFNEEGHLNELAIVRYSNHVHKDELETLEPALTTHVNDCVHCRVEVLRYSEFLENLPQGQIKTSSDNTILPKEKPKLAHSTTHSSEKVITMSSSSTQAKEKSSNRSWIWLAAASLIGLFLMGAWFFSGNDAEPKIANKDQTTPTKEVIAKDNTNTSTNDNGTAVAENEAKDAKTVEKDGENAEESNEKVAENEGAAKNSSGVGLTAKKPTNSVGGLGLNKRNSAGGLGSRLNTPPAGGGLAANKFKQQKPALGGGGLSSSGSGFGAGRSSTTKSSGQTTASSGGINNSQKQATPSTTTNNKIATNSKTNNTKSSTSTTSITKTQPTNNTIANNSSKTPEKAPAANNTTEEKKTAAPSNTTSDVDTKALFAGNFEAAEIYASTIRSASASDADKKNIKAATEAYESGDYKKAYQLFQSLNKDKKDINFNFYSGVCALTDQVNQTKAAKTYFDKVIQHGDNAFVKQAKWFQALALLKMGDIANAKKALQGLKGKAAKDLLGKLG